MHTGERGRLGRRAELDGLRGIAILLVLIGHGFQHYRIGAVAAAGVALFFVLSGYLITGILLDRPPLRTFYARRMTRLAPPLVVMVAAVLIVGRIRWTHAIGALTWTQNFTEWVIDTRPFGVTWSLAVEEQFYLVWPLVLALVPRRHLVTVLGCLFALLTVWRVHLAFGGGLTQSYVSPECASTAMVAGAFVYAARVRLRAWCGAVAALVATACTAWACAYGGGAWLLLPVLVIVPFAALLAAAPSLSRVLCRPWLIWCGLASYSMYLWHDTLPDVVHATGTPLGTASGALVGVAAYYVVERPVMRWRSQRQESGSVVLPDVISTVPPEVHATAEKFRSAPDVPTVPSKTAAPVESATRNQPAVPVAATVAVIVGVKSHVATPAAAAAADGSASVNVASSVPVAAVATVPGFAPV